MTEAKLEIADVSGLSAALASKQAAGALSTVQGIGGGQSLHDVGGGELRIRTLRAGAGLVRIGQLADGSVEVSGNVTVAAADAGVCEVSSAGELSFPNIDISYDSSDANKPGHVLLGGGAEKDRTDDYTVAIGRNALSSLHASIQRPTAIGSYALANAGGANYTVAVGDSAGKNRRAPRCVHVGYHAGSSSNEAGVGGSDNVFVGHEAGKDAAAVSRCVFLGSGQGHGEVASDKLRIGNRSNFSIIEGTMGADAAGSDISLNAARVVLPNLPTSAHGLPTGALWSDSGVVKVVPPT